MLVAVATIIGHNSMPHHHHAEIQLLAHHNDHHDEEGTEADHHQEQNKKDHHNIFSFAQLDEDFVPSQFNKINIDLPILYLLTPVITYQIDQLKEQSKNHFGYYREFPPPGNYLSDLFSRPPPAC
jgi:hypothetical protein